LLWWCHLLEEKKTIENFQCCHLLEEMSFNHDVLPPIFGAATWWHNQLER
jgi:hypothetical protein